MRPLLKACAAAAAALFLVAAGQPSLPATPQDQCVDNDNVSAARSDALAMFRSGEVPKGCASRQQKQESAAPRRRARTVGVFYASLEESSQGGATESATTFSIRASAGSVVRARESGVVEFVGTSREHGGEVVIRHMGTTSTYFAELDRVAVSIGDTVLAGEPIGVVSGLAYYQTARSLPDLIFDATSQTAVKSPQNPSLVISSATHFTEGRLRVFVNGVYVAEISPWNNHKVQLEGLRAGRHDFYIEPVDVPNPDRLRIQISRPSGRQTIEWKSWRTIPVQIE